MDLARKGGPWLAPQPQFPMAEGPYHHMDPPPNEGKSLIFPPPIIPFVAYQPPPQTRHGPTVPNNTHPRNNTK